MHSRWPLSDPPLQGCSSPGELWILSPQHAKPQKLLQIAQELLHTEETYVRRLHLLDQVAAGRGRPSLFLWAVSPASSLSSHWLGLPFGTQMTVLKPRQTDASSRNAHLLLSELVALGPRSCLIPWGSLFLAITS